MSGRGISQVSTGNAQNDKENTKAVTSAAIDANNQDVFVNNSSSGMTIAEKKYQLALLQSRRDELLKESAVLHVKNEHLASMIARIKERAGLIHAKNMALVGMIDRANADCRAVFVETPEFMNNLVSLYAGTLESDVQDHDGFGLWAEIVRTRECNHDAITLPLNDGMPRRGRDIIKGTRDGALEGLFGDGVHDRPLFRKVAENKVEVDKQNYSAYKWHMKRGYCGVCGYVGVSERGLSIHLMSDHAGVSSETVRRLYEQRYARYMRRPIFVTPRLLRHPEPRASGERGDSSSAENNDIQSNVSTIKRMDVDSEEESSEPLERSGNESDASNDGYGSSPQRSSDSEVSSPSRQSVVLADNLEGVSDDLVIDLSGDEDPFGKYETASGASQSFAPGNTNEDVQLITEGNAQIRQSENEHIRPSSALTDTVDVSRRDFQQTLQIFDNLTPVVLVSDIMSGDGFERRGHGKQSVKTSLFPEELELTAGGTSEGTQQAPPAKRPKHHGEDRQGRAKKNDAGYGADASARVNKETLSFEQNPTNLSLPQRSSNTVVTVPVRSSPPPHPPFSFYAQNLPIEDIPARSGNIYFVPSRKADVRKFIERYKTVYGEDITPKWKVWKNYQDALKNFLVEHDD